MNQDIPSDKNVHNKGNTKLSGSAFAARTGHPQVINGVLHHPSSNSKLGGNSSNGAIDVGGSDNSASNPILIRAVIS